MTVTMMMATRKNERERGDGSESWERRKEGAAGESEWGVGEGVGARRGGGREG
jgi:hypothetical protein